MNTLAVVGNHITTENIDDEYRIGEWPLQKHLLQNALEAGCSYTLFCVRMFLDDFLSTSVILAFAGP